VKSPNFTWLAGPSFALSFLSEGWGLELENVQSCSFKEVVVALCA
jgi:hypothetical protein